MSCFYRLSLRSEDRCGILGKSLFISSTQVLYSVCKTPESTMSQCCMMSTRHCATAICCTQRGVSLMVGTHTSRRHNARCGYGRCDRHRCAIPCRPGARAEENAMHPLPSYTGAPVIIIGNGPV